MKLSQLFGSESVLSSQIDRPVAIIAIVIYLIVLPAGIEPATL